MLGDYGVGKTSLLRSWSRLDNASKKNGFRCTSLHSRDGIKLITLRRGQKIKLNIRNTAGN